MSSRFDPTAFIASERESAPSVETVAIKSTVSDAFAVPSERADFLRFQADQLSNCRTIEGIEAPSAGRPWSQGLAALRALPRPYWLKGSRWDRLVYICSRFDHRWGAEAEARGWSTTDLYGCHPSPAACPGTWMNGLAASIFNLSTPVRVLEVGDDAIVLQPSIEPLGNIPPPPAGAPMKFRRHLGDRPGQSLIWQAYGMEGGP